VPPAPGTTGRILIASTEAAFSRIAGVLSAYRTRFVASFDDAVSALHSETFDLVMIGLYFDESRMFELLHYIKSDPVLERLPVLCFRGIVAADTRGRIRLDAIDAACKAKGAHDFFDLPGLPDAQAEARLCALIDKFLKENAVGP
jgi:CheY-like chemotaxis protein